MNKQLEEGKLLAEILNQKCKNFTFEKVGHSDGSFSYELNSDRNFIAIREREFYNIHNALRFSRFYSHHSPERMLEIYSHIEKLEAENKRFRGALEFYANKKSYSNDHDEHALFSRWCILYGDIEEINDSVGYAGKRAREALKESE